MALASYSFVLGFLPLALLAQRAIARSGARGSIAWLCVLSLAFCAWTDLFSAAVLLGSSAACFGFSRWILQRSARGRSSGVPLACGIALQLLLLGYFKYAGFASENLRALFGDDVPLLETALPLGLSFVSFQQIAYLVDTQRGDTREDRFLDFLLLVSFFPKLVAGPIADARKFTAQLSRPGFGRISDANLIVGLTLLGVGLFKKVVIADRLAMCANPIFDAAGQGLPIALVPAWSGAVAYAMQLYFDFSGYSDMAIGAARCFGIVLPINFYSPYQATSIVEYWRRWHISLSRFLTRYVYTPLATPLTRWAIARRLGRVPLFVLTVALPTLMTFALAGLWHGAGWTFIVFGVLHGMYLSVQHGWRELRRALWGRPAPSPIRAVGGWALTFAAVLVASVFFRAASLHEAVEVLRGMLGASASGAFDPALDLGPRQLRLLLVASALAFLAPNVAQILRPLEPALDLPRDEPLLRWLGPLPVGASLAITAVLWIVALGSLGDATEFLYYRF